MCVYRNFKIFKKELRVFSYGTIVSNIILMNVVIQLFQPILTNFIVFSFLCDGKFNNPIIVVSNHIGNRKQNEKNNHGDNTNASIKLIA